jgi:hypothetical protein
VAALYHWTALAARFPHDPGSLAVRQASSVTSYKLECAPRSGQSLSVAAGLPGHGAERARIVASVRISVV